MQIKIRFHGIFREDIGKKEIVLTINTHETKLIHIIDKLIEEIGERAKKIKESIFMADGARIIILINGRNAIYSGWLNTQVKDGDLIDIIPPLTGGVLKSNFYFSVL